MLIEYSIICFLVLAYYIKKTFKLMSLVESAGEWNEAKIVIKHLRIETRKRIIFKKRFFYIYGEYTINKKKFGVKQIAIGKCRDSVFANIVKQIENKKSDAVVYYNSNKPDVAYFQNPNKFSFTSYYMFLIFLLIFILFGYWMLLS